MAEVQSEARPKPTTLKQIAVLAALALGAFAAGAVIGYVNGASGDDGNSTRAID